jgi:4-diphosphocytidyl-2-C-methyl-D-erythritol kinase
VLLFPNAKINIGLFVTEKRPDGFHNLETIFYPVPFCDVLEIFPNTASFEMHLYGISIEGSSSDNLCAKAWRLLHTHFDIPPVHLHLLKNIPAGAGLGGGSADGVFALKGLVDLYELAVSDADMLAMAAALGSDCPFFLHNRPVLAKGRGEVMTSLPLSLSGYYLVLLHLPIHVSTRDAFMAIAPKKAPTAWQPTLPPQSFADWSNVRNDFEIPIFDLHPSIAQLKNDLLSAGALFAAMTGTGSAVYGIFTSPPTLDHRLQKSVCWAGELE